MSAAFPAAREAGEWSAQHAVRGFWGQCRADGEREQLAETWEVVQGESRYL